MTSSLIPSKLKRKLSILIRPRSRDSIVEQLDLSRFEIASANAIIKIQTGRSRAWFDRAVTKEPIRDFFKRYHLMQAPSLIRECPRDWNSIWLTIFAARRNFGQLHLGQNYGFSEPKQKLKPYPPLKVVQDGHVSDVLKTTQVQFSQLIRKFPDPQSHAVEYPHHS